MNKSNQPNTASAISMSVMVISDGSVKFSLCVKVEMLPLLLSETTTGASLIGNTSTSSVTVDVLIGAAPELACNVPLTKSCRAPLKFAAGTWETMPINFVTAFELSLTVNADDTFIELGIYEPTAAPTATI